MSFELMEGFCFVMSMAGLIGTNIGNDDHEVHVYCVLQDGSWNSGALKQEVDDEITMEAHEKIPGR
jgi:hypothetical protein